MMISIPVFCNKYNRSAVSLSTDGTFFINTSVFISLSRQFVSKNLFYGQIQIRTIAMDFWASLEHQLKYKPSAAITPEISEELRDCAERIAATDLQMQRIFMEINDLG